MVEAEKLVRYMIETRSITESDDDDANACKISRKYILLVIFVALPECVRHYSQLDVELCIWQAACMRVREYLLSATCVGQVMQGAAAASSSQSELAMQVSRLAANGGSVHGLSLCLSAQASQFLVKRRH
jgi:hypothetical protein